jgi:hypothetical protein
MAVALDAEPCMIKVPMECQQDKRVEKHSEYHPRSKESRVDNRSKDVMNQHTNSPHKIAQRINIDIW